MLKAGVEITLPLLPPKRSLLSFLSAIISNAREVTQAKAEVEKAWAKHEKALENQTFRLQEVERLEKAMLKISQEGKLNGCGFSF